MSPIWAALNKKLAPFMKVYNGNGPLKHHRYAGYGDTTINREYVTMSMFHLKNRRKAFINCFMDIIRSTGCKQLFLWYAILLTDKSQVFLPESMPCFCLLLCIR